ncbi:STAS domain-containing protein [Saccharomonospora xinjiangensis]|uniref:STAS domain-containing protein n=1 Tax=Saccharomonospora xinjiangensis TaxID=75294 RepID=UPI00350F07FC
MACTKDDLDLRVERPVAGLVVIRVAGEIDILGAPTLRRCIESCVFGASALVLDLSGTTFFGAAGLSVLVRTSALVERRHVRWALVCPTAVLRPLRVTDLDRELPVCTDFAEAVAVAASPALS